MEKGQKPPKPKGEELRPSREGAKPSAGQKESVTPVTKQLKKNKKKQPAAAEAAGSVEPVKAGKRQYSETGEPGAGDAGRSESKKQRHLLEAHLAPGAAASEERPEPSISANGNDEQAAAMQHQSRLATFAKPTLAKPEKKKKKKRTKTEDAQQQPQAMSGQGVQLTKAQRKNLWRQKRRALLKQQQGPE